MTNQRIKQLLQWLENEPNDTFLLYALATEYKNVEVLIAINKYEELVKVHPNYLPTYYHLAQLYVDTKQTEKAEITFQQGIKLAQEQREQKALAELQSAYNNFLYE